MSISRIRLIVYKYRTESASRLVSTVHPLCFGEDELLGVWNINDTENLSK